MSGNQSITVDSIMAELHNLNERLATAEARAVEAEHQVLEMKKHIAFAPSDHTTPAQQTVPTLTIFKRPKPKLPDLHLFSGKRTEYKVWALAARQKLELDGASIGSETDQYCYLFSRMAVEAQNLVAVYYERGLAANLTATMFLQHLNVLFLDPNASERALSKLVSTPQKENEAFAVYLPKFEKMLHEAEIDGDRNCIAYLSNNLNMELSRALVGSNIPTTYTNYVSYLHTTASQLEQVNHRARHIARLHRNPLTKPTPPPMDTDAMDWTPTPVSGAALKPLTEQERLYLRSNNGCFRCRQVNAGHISRNCPRGQVPAFAANVPTDDAHTTALKSNMSENGQL